MKQNPIDVPPPPAPNTPAKILIAFQSPAGLATIRDVLQSSEDCEIKETSETEAFLKITENEKPTLVVTTPDFGTFSFLKFARESHTQIPYILIQENESPVSNIFHKGINIYISQNEIHRLLPWVEILLTVKSLPIGKEPGAEAIEQMRTAVSKPTDRIYSPSLEQLRREAIRSAPRTQEERDTAIRNWTREIEEKKSGNPRPPSPTHREDPFLPAVDASCPTTRAILSLDPTVARETIVSELLKMQTEMASQLAQLNTELIEIKRHQKRGFEKKRNK